jgi:PAS domain S-box-containing protein
VLLTGRVNRWLLGAAAFYLVMVALVIYGDYRQNRAQMIAEVDQRLLVVALGVPHVLPVDFHDRATGPEAIDPAEDRRNQLALTEYATVTGVRYAWTDIEVEGQFFLTACNRTEQSDEPGLETDYFTAYGEVNAAEKQASGGREPVFTTFTDRWGTFRAVFLPQSSPGGRRYLACAEYETASLDRALLNRALRSLISAAVLLLAILPLFLVFLNNSRAHAQRLAAANDELASSRRSLAATLDAIDQAVIATDQAGQIVRVNPVACRLTGWPADAALGQSLDTVLRLVDHETKEERAGLFQQVSSTRAAVHLDHGTCLRTREGVLCSVEAGATLIPGEQGPLGVVAVLRDVTERLQLEARLRQSEKLETVGRLAGGIAHDFNNLLMTIMGSAELLAEGVAGQDQLADDVERIRAASRRAAELTQQLMIFSRRKPNLDTVIDVHGVVDELSILLGHSLDRGIDLDIRLEADRCRVLGDATRFSSALMNLVINARDAMPQGGTLTIRTANRQGAEGALAGRDLIELMVADTGCGMSAEVREHLFEPFFTTKEVGEGTGLGLAVAYATVQSLGGIIRVESEPRAGTTFRVLLPLTSTEPAPPPPAPTSDPDFLAGRRILLVEDESDLRALARKVLERFGCVVATACDGLDAETQLRRADAPFDAVILDLVMPRRDGFATFTVLRDLAPAVPVLVCSGFDASARAQDLLAEPATGYLAKPYDRTELVVALTRLISRPVQPDESPTV